MKDVFPFRFGAQIEHAREILHRVPRRRAKKPGSPDTVKSPPDFLTVYVFRPDGTREIIELPDIPLFDIAQQNTASLDIRDIQQAISAQREARVTRRRE